MTDADREQELGRAVQETLKDALPFMRVDVLLDRLGLAIQGALEVTIERRTAWWRELRCLEGVLRSGIMNELERAR